MQFFARGERIFTALGKKRRRFSWDLRDFHKHAQNLDSVPAGWYNTTHRDKGVFVCALAQAKAPFSFPKAFEKGKYKGQPVPRERGKVRAARQVPWKNPFKPQAERGFPQ